MLGAKDGGGGFRSEVLISLCLGASPKRFGLLGNPSAVLLFGYKQKEPWCFRD